MSKTKTGWPRKRKKLGLLPSVFETSSLSFFYQLSLGKTTIHFSTKESFFFLSFFHFLPSIAIISALHYKASHSVYFKLVDMAFEYML